MNNLLQSRNTSNASLAYGVVFSHDTSLKFFLVTQVVIANYECDTESNRPLAEKMEIGSFPTIKFYPKGQNKTAIVRTKTHSMRYLLNPIQVYDDGRTAEEFVAYLNAKCGTSRAVGGGLNDQVYFPVFTFLLGLLKIIQQAGRVPELDSLAQQFATAKGSTRKKVYDSAVGLAGSDSKHGSVYLRVMEKMLNGADEYLEKETKRCVWR